MTKLNTLILAALCVFSIAQADVPFSTMSDLENEMVGSVEGEFFIDVNDEWQPIHTILVDENGFCYLPIGKKHKKYESYSDSEEELSCILECPDCGRFQTCSKVTQNKGRCSNCRQIFPASELAWTCTNCGTPNYLNPDKCGWPSCRCPRHLCDPDVKNNVKPASRYNL